jgi:nucleoside-diphosphate-sugar epimerase
MSEQVKQQSPSAYAGRRVLVTGASGFIGRWVARSLHSAGANLWIGGRDAKRLRGVCEANEIRAQICVADLSEPGAFKRVFRDAQPEITFHLAGYGVDPVENQADLAEALNARLVWEIAETIAGASRSDWNGLRFVHAGSAAEYGPVAGELTEETEAHPVSLYGKTKLTGTRRLTSAITDNGLRAITARLFTVYGPGEHPNRLLPSLIKASQSGEQLSLTKGEQLRDFTYVGDVSEGVLRLGSIAGPLPTVVNLATGILTSVREFAECAGELLGLRNGQLQFGALSYRSDEVRQSAADTHRMEQLTGWRPAISIREGIQRTIAFQSRLSGARA